MSNIDDAPFGWDSDFQQERAAFLEQETGDDYIDLTIDPVTAGMLTSALALMVSAASMAITDGRVSCLSLAISDLQDVMDEVDVITPELLSASLVTVGATAFMLQHAVLYRAARDADADDIFPHLRMVIDRLALVSKKMNHMADMVAKQQELDRKRSLYRRRQ